MQKNTAQNQLYDLLVSKDFGPVKRNSGGSGVIDDDDADMIAFDYRTPSGKDYGTVVILFTKDNGLTIFFGDNLGRTMEPEEKDSWFKFLEQLRFFAKRHRLTFDLKPASRMKYMTKSMANVNESLFESLSGNSKQSWSTPDKGARMLINHTRRLGEDDARFRHIDSIFIETTDGERFKLPFRSLGGAKAMLEHVRQGGRPYDIRGQHVIEMVTELGLLSRFRRAHHGKVFEGTAKTLIEQSENYYQSLKRDLKRISYGRGYENYFESWQPMEVTDNNMMVEDLRNMFIEQTLDTRIESALPLLARLRGEPMKELNEFEQWSQQITEGTWAVPDTPESKNELEKLLAKPIVVGPDGNNATELLYEIFGDDTLFDRIETLAMEDPDADARPLVIARMEELGLEVPASIQQAQQDQTASNEPAPSAPAAPAPVAPASPTPVAQTAQTPMAEQDLGKLKSVLSRLIA